jgi:hypothetical protein
MSKFRDAVLRQIAAIPLGCAQGVDAFEREMENREGRAFWFLKWRLDRLVRRGVIRRGKNIRSVFRSYDGTPTYGPVDESVGHEGGGDERGTRKDRSRYRHGAR